MPHCVQARAGTRSSKLEAHGTPLASPHSLDTTAAANNYLGIALYVIVVVTCTVTFWQDKATADVLASINGMMASSTAVIRDGCETRIDPTDLVPGDLVRLCLGDRVPADLRVIATSDLKTECSSLTGEPDAITATVNALHDAPIECRNVVFSSSLVMNGEGYGVVIKTGDATMIGSIASLAGGSGINEETLLEKEVHRFVNFVAVIAVVSAFMFFGIGMGRKRPFVSSFVNGFIVVLVANIPEGLPATVTSCLSITAKRMAARHVLVKRTNIIESLGSATVIASDKTGTLTQNRMSVENLWYCRNVFNAYAGGGPQLYDQMARSTFRKSSDGVGAPQPSKKIDLSSLNEDSEVTIDGGASVLRLTGSKATSRKGSLDRQIMDALGEGGAGGYASHAQTQQTLNSFTISGFASNTIMSMPGGKLGWKSFSAHARVLTIAGVCNRARYEDGPSGALGSVDRAILGDASDAGLLRYCDKVYPVAIARRTFPKVFEIPFNSVNKWSLAIVPDPAQPTKTHIVFMKGAPEIIVARCTDYMYHNTTRPVDEDFMEEYTSAYERFGSCGERVLGFAYRVIDASKPELYATEEGRPPTEGLTFCGLISLVDPPRPGVAEAIGLCRKAGIKVTMVTGDHPLTAEAIARKVGIITKCTVRDIAQEDGVPERDIPLSDTRAEAVVVTGSQIGGLSQDDWDAILSKPEVVFARTSPQQKLLLVEHYQRRGEVVAVTGDGVNDSPALKRAQIGVAMGSANASDVAREAADIILLDDNFASIVAAIEEGRTLFDNLKKTIAYTLAHLWPELLPIFLNLAFSFPLALNGLMILTIDLLTEQGPAISLAYENAEAAVMSRPPRDLKRDRLVSAPSLVYSYLIAGVGNSLVSMFCYFLVYINMGISVRQLAYSLDSGYFAYPPFEKNAAGLWTSKGSVVPILVASDGSGRSYDALDQWNIFCESQAAWYLTLVLNQAWHVWNCRTRSVSIFTHGIFSNAVTVYGVVAEVAIACAVIYIPAFQSTDAFQTRSLHGTFWLPHFIYAGYIFGYNEAVKWFIRNRPHGKVAQLLAW